MGLPQSHIKFRVFTQGLCCLSGFQKPLEQVSFPGLKNTIWVRMVKMELWKLYQTEDKQLDPSSVMFGGCHSKTTIPRMHFMNTGVS